MVRDAALFAWAQRLPSVLQRAVACNALEELSGHIHGILIFDPEAYLDDIVDRKVTVAHQLLVEHDVPTAADGLEGAFKRNVSDFAGNA